MDLLVQNITLLDISNELIKKYNMETETIEVREKIFTDKFGGQIKSKQMLWDEIVKNSPQNVDLSEEEIMEVIREVRYGKVQDNN